MFSTWKKLGQPKIRQKLKKIVKNRINNHEYELPKEVRTELNKIYKKALSEFKV